MDKSPENSSEDNQQGIFSMPDLTVDAEKIAQDTEATNEANRSKIASIFANTETGQRAQQLNDAMGVRAEQTAPITEDLVIQNEPKKKSKVPIIVGAIILVLTAIGAAGWLILNNLPQETTQTASISSLRKSFNEFANFFLYNKESNDDIEEFYRYFRNAHWR